MPATLQPPSAPVGLRNLGNTCYVSAALQFLAAIPDFCSALYRLESSLAQQDIVRQLRCALTPAAVSLRVRLTHRSSAWLFMRPLSCLLSLTGCHAVHPSHHITLSRASHRTQHHNRPSTTPDAMPAYVSVLVPPRCTGSSSSPCSLALGAAPTQSPLPTRWHSTMLCSRMGKSFSSCC